MVSLVLHSRIDVHKLRNGLSEPVDGPCGILSGPSRDKTVWLTSVAAEVIYCHDLAAQFLHAGAAFRWPSAAEEETLKHIPDPQHRRSGHAPQPSGDLHNPVVMKAERECCSMNATATKSGHGRLFEPSPFPLKPILCVPTAESRQSVCISTARVSNY
jgi:hypothetical protein